MADVIKAQVRREKDGELALFYWEHFVGASEINCFTFSEGHNTACNDYRLECEKVSKKEAEKFALKVESYYNSLPFVKCKIQAVERLNINQNRGY